MSKAFIPYIMCGDPDLETIEKLIASLVEAGADAIELGIPFSDPVAEGPVIQAASSRALQQNVDANALFSLVEKVRKTYTIPLYVMTYSNVVFAYGIEKFVQRMQEVGLQGLILPDVPYEEKEEFDAICRKYQIDLISLITLTSSSRLEKIAKKALGFLYCVSSLGITGTRASLHEEIFDVIEQARDYTPIPCLIGFGISNAQQARQMARKSDGIIIGSAIVQLCEKYGREAPEPVHLFAKSVREALTM